MQQSSDNFIQWLDRLNPGAWLVVISGVVMLCACLLYPAYIELKLEYEKTAKVKAELDYHQAHLDRHDQMMEAWKHKDPQLLQRLGWHQLRLQRESLRTVNGSTAHRHGQHWREWLIPASGQLEAYPRAQLPKESRLTRILEQPRMRRWIIAAGTFLVFSGLMLTWMRSEDEEDEEEQDIDEYVSESEFETV